MVRLIKLQAVVLFACVVFVKSRGTVNLTESALDVIILHNNDLHGHFDEQCSPKCFGGFARQSTIVKKFRNDYEKGNGPPVLFLNAGDTYTGTPWFQIFKDRIASEMMNALKPNASVSVHKC